MGSAAVRHLTREQRQEVVAKLRAEGWSLPRIAEKLDIGIGTAHRDVAAGFPNGKPDDKEVQGKDGKTYPATRPAVVTTNAVVPGGGMRRRPQDRRRGHGASGGPGTHSRARSRA